MKCPHCGGTEYTQIGKGETSEEYEYIPAKFVRRVHLRQKMACKCGCHVVTAAPPVRVSECVKYGPAFHAHVAVSKCADSIPLHRQARQLTRIGIPTCRSTLCDIFHRSASLLAPISRRIFKKIKESEYINADETRIGVQDGTTAYVWNFSTEKYVGYVFNQSRSGETPKYILGDSTGFLQVDQYSGYNQVTTPGKRSRVGCLAHMRRKFFEAKDVAPKDCKWMMEQIRDLYIVEYDAAEADILGSDQHLAMRKARSKLIMNDIKQWIDENENRWGPKNKMGRAVRYALNNWDTLMMFLENPKLQLDNNLAERELRIIALGRKNFLFVGHEEAGENLAVLQTLISTCMYLKINPLEYLTDVLIRIQTHPVSEIDDLLPDRWQPPDGSPGEIT